MRGNCLYTRVCGRRGYVPSARGRRQRRRRCLRLVLLLLQPPEGGKLSFCFSANGGCCCCSFLFPRLAALFNINGRAAAASKCRTKEGILPPAVLQANRKAFYGAGCISQRQAPYWRQSSAAEGNIFVSRVLFSFGGSLSPLLPPPPPPSFFPHPQQNRDTAVTEAGSGERFFFSRLFFFSRSCLGVTITPWQRRRLHVGPFAAALCRRKHTLRDVATTK